MGGDGVGEVRDERGGAVCHPLKPRGRPVDAPSGTDEDVKVWSETGEAVDRDDLGVTGQQGRNLKWLQEFAFRTLRSHTSSI